MKNFFKACSCLAICSLLFACVPNKPQGTPIIAPKPVEATATIQATLVQPAPTNPMPTFSGALPTISFNTTPINTPLTGFTPVGPPPTVSFDQMQFPIFLEPAAIPGLLQSHLTLETLPAFNGHALQRISGWKFGIKNLAWMDEDHLLLYPVAGGYSIGGSTQPGVYPAVANLNSNTFWIPLPDRQGGDYYPTLPRWSDRLGALIAPTSEGSVAVYSPDGKARKVYEGKFLGISPSATKLLIDDRWIDLGSGKTVDFAWDDDPLAIDRSAPYFPPIWSPDEMRVYACCYRYGDARTGTGLAMPHYGAALRAEKKEPAVIAFDGTWVLNGKYLMPIWGGIWDGRYSAVYLFDPAAKVYRNLSELAGVPDPWETPDPYCTQPSAQSGGRYVWVDCVDGGHLIDAATFRSRTYPPPADGPYGGGFYKTRDTDWSADGNFVWFNEEESKSILSGATGELKPLPRDCYGFEWHPKDNILLCMSDDDQKLLLLEAQTLSIKKEFALPAKFEEFSWSPDGKHIELVASDKSIWRVAYPRLDNLEQLTPPLSQLVGQNSSIPLTSNPLWSPDHTAMAIGGTDGIYIVHVNDIP